MSSDSTTERIREFIVAEFGVPAGSTIDEDDSLLTGGLVDSMGILSLVEFIESDFGIVVVDVDLVASNFESIAAIRDFVQMKSDGARVD